MNVPMSTWERPSRPPRWGVLEATPLPSGEPAPVGPTRWPITRRDSCVRRGPGREQSRAAVVAARRPVRCDRPAADQRGSFRELWRAGDFPDEPFVQANLSTSSAGVLRGLHLHQRQDDLWIVAEGRAFVALVDIGPMLDGTGNAPRIETRGLRLRRMGRHPRPASPTGSSRSTRSSSSTW